MLFEPPLDIVSACLGQRLPSLEDWIGVHFSESIPFNVRKLPSMIEERLEQKVWAASG